ncbi:MAG: hypothetical protein ABI132_02555 [Rhodanobacteraceae bacterium]
MNTTPDKPVRKHTRAWLIALLLAFAVGFLLACWLMRRHPVAPPTCPQTSQAAPANKASPAGGGGAHGAGAPGTGSPAKLGAKGDGTGTVIGNAGQVTGSGAPASLSGGGNGDGDLAGGGANSGSGNTVSSGGDSKVSGGGEIEASGGGNGTTTPGDDQSLPQPASSATPANGTQPVTATSGGALQLGPPNSDLGVDNSKPAGKVVTALDYRYDQSGLPHYPNAIKVASGTDAAAAAGPNSKNFSVTEIVTDDAPDVAAAWYHDHLPAGWKELQMPSALVMDQAIAQSKTPSPNESPVNAMLNAMIVGPQLERDKPGVDAARAAGLTIFQPPDQNTDHRMIIVIKDSKTGKTGVLLMKKADQS